MGGGELTLDSLSWQLVLNFLTVQAIQYVKTNNSSWLNWLNKDTPRLTKFVSAIISAATAVGIHMKFGHGDPAVAGSYIISISGLTVMAVVHAGKDLFQNYFGIKLLYRMTRPDDVAFRPMNAPKPPVENLGPKTP